MDYDKKDQLDGAAADVRRLQAALDQRLEEAPDNLLEQEMLLADLKRADLHWRRLLRDVLGSEAPVLAGAR